MKEQEFRTRNWATIVYPDSAPDNWQEILESHLIQCFISPFHDKDYDPFGENKKPHWHVILMFDTVKSERQVKEIISSFSGVGCIKINSLRCYTRYLCHMDNPEKYQYDPGEVISLYGADYLEICSSESDRFAIIDEIIDFIDNMNITSFYLLCKYARKENESWKRILTTQNTIFFKEYIKSKQWSLEHDIRHIVDVHGEVVI